MYLLFSLFTYNFNGDIYDSTDKTVLISVKASTVDYELPKSVISIQDGDNSPFQSSSPTIRSFTCEKDSQLNYIPANLFRGTSIQTADFSNCKSLTFISDGCFHWASQLSKITLPPNIQTIGKGSFHCCMSLTTIFFPNTLTTLSDWDSDFGCCLGYCSKLSTIEFGVNPGLQYIGSNAFYESGLTSFYITKSIRTINNGAFAKNQIVFSSDPENQYFSTDGRSIYSKDGTTLYIVSTKTYNDVYVVNEKVTRIQNQAFRNVPGDTVIFQNPNVILDDLL